MILLYLREIEVNNNEWWNDKKNYFFIEELYELLLEKDKKNKEKLEWYEKIIDNDYMVLENNY